MDFIKGFQTQEGMVLLGQRFNLYTIQGEVFNNVVLSSCAKKKLGFVIDGAIGERVLTLDTIDRIELIEVEDEE